MREQTFLHEAAGNSDLQIERYMATSLPRTSREEDYDIRKRKSSCAMFRMKNRRLNI